MASRPVLVSLRGDLGRFAPGAMIAPEIVIVQRLQVLAHRNDAGAGGIERDRRYLRAVHLRCCKRRVCVARASAAMWSAWLCVA